MCIQMTRKRYPTDLTNAQWELLAPLIPETSPNATQPTIPRREIVNGVLYVLRTGCAWRHMPHDLLKREKPSTIISVSGNSRASGNKR